MIKVVMKPLGYKGTGLPVYPMDVILAKQEIMRKEKENEKSRSQA